MSAYKFPLQRKAPPARNAGPIVAYDLETSRIPRDPSDPLSVDPKYLTGFGADVRLSVAVADYRSLGSVVAKEFLTQARLFTRYYAWNANRFDVRLIMDGLLQFDDGGELLLQPLVAKQGGLRGVVVALAKHPSQRWYFYDGMAALGLQCKLDQFLAVFAPRYRKHQLDLDRIEFDPRDPRHIAYAQRDAEGLYYGMVEAEKRMIALTGCQLTATIGKVGIRSFIASMPSDAKVGALRPAQEKITRDLVLRGGYVYTARQYDGPAWSYDLNQAYAWAMRDTALPCGLSAAAFSYQEDLVGIYQCVISRTPAAPAPFYVRAQDGMPVESFGDPIRTALTSIEIDCLRRHGWAVEIISGFVWAQSFKMKAFADRLETLRRKHKAGTPVNVLCKAIGCNAYGKLSEAPQPWRYVVSRLRPEGALSWRPDDPAAAHIFIMYDDRDNRQSYHRPHIAAFITAAVRVRLYDAIMLAPEAFLKADTDSVTFSRPVKLPLSTWRYGDWKVESDGLRHVIVGKKCYARAGLAGEAPHFVCKGLHTAKLTFAHFEAWLARGEAPMQTQMQLCSFKTALRPRYRAIARRGADFSRKRSRNR